MYLKDQFINIIKINKYIIDKINLSRAGLGHLSCPLPYPCNLSFINIFLVSIVLHLFNFIVSITHLKKYNAYIVTYNGEKKKYLIFVHFSKLLFFRNSNEYDAKYKKDY